MSEKQQNIHADFETFISAAYGGGLHLLNTSIIPPRVDGRWVIQTVNDETARGLCAVMIRSFGSTPYVHIGHDATAVVAGEVLALGKIDPDRTPWDGKGLGLAVQLRGRIAEGAILTREQMDEIGYDIRMLYRLGADGLPEDMHRPGRGEQATKARVALDALLTQDAKITFLRRKDSRSGAHRYYGARIGDGPDLGALFVDVLMDPLARTKETARLGYSGSGDQGKTIMVWVGERASDAVPGIVFQGEHDALTNLCRQIAHAIGRPELQIPWEVL